MTTERERAAEANARGLAMHDGYEQTGDAADLDRAVEYFWTAAGRDPGAAVYLSNLGNALRARFERYGRDEDRQAALTVGRRAVRAGGPQLTMALTNLALALRVSFEWTGAQRQLSEAIRVARRAAELTVAGDPDRASRLSDLGAVLRTRYEWRGRSADLDEAARAGAEAVRGPEDDPDRPMYLSNFALTLLDRFDRDGSGADLDRAIELLHDALAMTAAGHPDRPIYLSNLGLALRVRYDHTDRSADLDGAIGAGREAVAATPVGHPDAALYRGNLSAAFWSRYERLGTRDDLAEAIEVARQAVRDTAAGHVSAAVVLANLGLALRARFEATGDEHDLDEAIHVERRGVAGVPEDHPHRADYLANLSLSLRVRYERLGMRRDIDEAVRAGRRAVAATTAGHPYRAAFLANLGNTLQARFELNGRLRDVHEAVTAGLAAVRAAPAGHPDRPMFQCNAGLALIARYERSSDPADLSAAVRAGRAAVRGAAPDHPMRPAYLADLSGTLRARYELHHRRKDLDEAAALAREAADAVPDDHPDQAIYLLAGAAAEHARGNTADAIHSVRRASGIQAAAVAVRLDAAYKWGSWAWQAGDRREAARGYDAAVTLLPLLVWHGLDRGTQEDSLARWPGLVSQAVSCLVAAGRPERAVELAELGRSLLWSQLLGLRTDLSELADRHPETAAELGHLRERLDHPAAWSVAAARLAPTDRTTTAGAGERRLAWAREWDAALARARTLPGFEDLLLAPPFATLAGAAADGPVALVNTSELGCHALVIRPGTSRVRVVRLIGVEHAEVLRRASAMLSRRVTDAQAGETLRWLWTTVARPVLAALGPGPPTRRLWWCPIGALAFLPLHAAGTAQRSVLDRVVPSYTPTLRALSRARARTPAGPVRQLVAALPETPELAPLPGVRREIGAVTARVPGSLRLIGPQATHAAVRSELPRHSWVHLSCHARQDPASPTGSAFLLWDWPDRPLTLGALAALRLDGADLAYLSACRTSTGDTRLRDESLHLAAAMQVIGFRHVVATLWPVRDTPAARLARAFYRGLTSAGTPDSSVAAAALGKAVRDLRDKFPEAPLSWAAFVHFGP
jgi:tetratricopeptide (TPR) repeat protein